MTPSENQKEAPKIRRLLKKGCVINMKKVKKQTIFGITLSVLCIAGLAFLGLFLMLDQKNDERSSLPVSESASSEKETAPELSTEENTQKNQLDDQTARAFAAAQAASAPLPSHHLIFVGDSRTVGMGEAEAELLDDCTYIGEVGEGYRWFTESGISQMEDAIKTHPDSPVVLNLGVNDLDLVEDYLKLYETFDSRYPDTDFYFLSVNPVTEQSHHVTNMEIAAFNEKLKSSFPDQYLDSNIYLRSLEFESPDGVHYSYDTYQRIHDYAVRQILSRES